MKDNLLETIGPKILDTLCENKIINCLVSSVFDIEPDFKFKQQHSLQDRKIIYEEIIRKYPHKIPVIVEFENEKKILKLMVDPDDLIASLIFKIRQSYKIKYYQSIFIVTDINTVAFGTQSILEFYKNYLCEIDKTTSDKILYFKVYYENTFGFM